MQAEPYEYRQTSSSVQKKSGAGTKLDPPHAGKNAFIQTALEMTRKRWFHLGGEIVFHLIEEALELLLRQERRRLAGQPDIVIVIAAGQILLCFSEEQEMSYRVINQDTKEVGPENILAEKVESVDEELQHRQSHGSNEKEMREQPDRKEETNEESGCSSRDACDL